MSFIRYVLIRLLLASFMACCFLASCYLHRLPRRQPASIEQARKWSDAERNRRYKAGRRWAAAPAPASDQSFLQFQ